jgi:UDP-N-acetylmuramyl pentapeptide phosphotransferase/UDP-N-acetylglucosamine-1-phosphate transferase
VTVLYAVLAAWLIGAAGTVLAIRYAHARALLDQPGDRRSHQVPTPRGGGVAIVAAIVLVGLALLMQQWSREGIQMGLLMPFLAGFSLVAAIGWVDDHRPLPASARLLVHVVAAAMFALAIWSATSHPGLTLVAFVAPLVLTNVWNFMDGINGIAASQAMVVAGFLSLALGGVWMTLALAMVAATWAFLPFNFPRAKVFMGDVGSGALGFGLGALVTMAAWQTIESAPMRVSVMVLALPFSAFLVDATLTLAGRMLRGERWWAPHVQHAYQGAARLLGHGRVTMGFLGWTLVACVLALYARSRSDIFVVTAVAVWYTLGAASWWQLQRWARAREVAVRSRNSA